MNDIARIYRAEILRAVLGPGAHAAKAIDLHRLNKISEHLAECEQAQIILRAKGYGGAGLSLLDAARSVPENVRKILAGLFKSKAPARAPDICDAHEPWRAT